MLSSCTGEVPFHKSELPKESNRTNPPPPPPLVTDNPISPRPSTQSFEIVDDNVLMLQSDSSGTKGDVSCGDVSNVHTKTSSEMMKESGKESDREDIVSEENLFSPNRPTEQYDSKNPPTDALFDPNPVKTCFETNSFGDFGGEFGGVSETPPKEFGDFGDNSREFAQFGIPHDDLFGEESSSSSGRLVGEETGLEFSEKGKKP